MLDNYVKMISDTEKHIMVAKSQRKILTEQQQELILQIKSLKDESSFVMTEKEFIKEVCHQGRTEAGSFLKNLVTNSVQYILGDEYSINIKFDERGATPTAEILVKTDIGGYEVEVDPASEDGGGIADIVALVFQALYIVITSPDSDTPIILDEPTKFVSKGQYAANTANFLCELAETYNKQILMVTHDSTLASIANLSFDVSIDEFGSSVVKTIKI